MDTSLVADDIDDSLSLSAWSKVMGVLGRYDGMYIGYVCSWPCSLLPSRLLGFMLLVYR